MAGYGGEEEKSIEAGQGAGGGGAGGGGGFDGGGGGGGRSGALNPNLLPAGEGGAVDAEAEKKARLARQNRDFALRLTASRKKGNEEGGGGGVHTK